jgi:hypothetical protein
MFAYLLALVQVLDVNYSETQSDGVICMDIAAKDSIVPMRRRKRAAADSVEVEISVYIIHCYSFPVNQSIF